MAAESEDSFDIELFIEEIHNLPCIWNYTSAAYSNPIEKAKAWEYLCCKFCENFEVKDKKDKTECAVKLQRKWRSLRDSYNRELKKTNILKNGPGASKHRQYLYFNNLCFLKPIAERRATEGSVNKNDGQCMDGSRKSTKRKTPKATLQESPLIMKLSPHVTDRISKQDYPVDHTDSDLHFLLSLYERFKSIDGQFKLQAQIEILNVIQKYNRSQPPEFNYNDGFNIIPYESRQHTMQSHTQYPIPVGGLELRVPSRVNTTEISANNTQPVFSIQSVSTDANSTLLNNFKKEFL